MNYNIWTRFLTILAVAAMPLTLGAVPAAQASDKKFTVADFKLHSAQELADVCQVPADHEHYNMAIAFCYGFFEGAVHYDEAISGLDWYNDLVCPPPEASRQMGVAVFVDYIEANPQYALDSPIDGVFRSLIDKWPCEQ